MAHYLVRAKPKDNLDELRAQLDEGRISKLRPFGGEMQQCLGRARIDAAGYATWEENCYCNPPLKQERAVLDKYFEDLTTQTVSKGAAWSQIEALPSLWG